MNIGIFSISSAIQNKAILDKNSSVFLNEIAALCGLQLNYCGSDFTKFDEYDLQLIFIRTGGSEAKFMELYPNLKGPYYLLTTGENNSLAASMEILSYLRDKGETAEIIHGNINYVAKRITDLAKVNTALNIINQQAYGVIGEPSDWLIASRADYFAIKQKTGADIIDISMEEFVSEIDKKSYPDDASVFLSANYDKSVMQTALYIYGALLRIINKYNLSAITVRCFDLLSIKRNTSCLALALLNKSGITAACEGDVPAMMSMAILRALTGKSSFQANPSSIDIDTNKIIFAHCTIPLDMVNGYTLDTHFESGLGVAIKGKVPTGDATIFKVSGNLEKYFVSDAQIEENLSSPNLCRTQIVLKPKKSVSYFLKNSIGNHHIIIPGYYETLIDEFFNRMNNKV